MEGWVVFDAQVLSVWVGTGPVLGALGAGAGVGAEVEVKRLTGPELTV